MRRLSSALIASALLLASGSARAQGEIQSLRLSAKPQFDRVVLDLGVAPVTAEQSTRRGTFFLELDAPRPDLPRDDEERMARLGVYLEPLGSDQSRLVVEQRGRSVRVFRLPGQRSQGEGDRIVVDVGRREGRALSLPEDAVRIQRKGGVRGAPRRPEPPPVSAEPRRGRDRDAPRRRLREIPDEVQPPSLPEPVAAVRESPGGSSRSSRSSGSGDWLLVRSIEVVEGSERIPLEDLDDVQVTVSPMRGGYAAPREGRPVEQVPLRALIGDDRNGRRVAAELVPGIAQSIERARRGLRVGVSGSDLDRLRGPSSDGRLILRARRGS